VPSKTSAPDAQQKRLAAYPNRLTLAAGHAGRHQPLKGYGKGLLLPLKRKSVEPMAAGGEAQAGLAFCGVASAAGVSRLLTAAERTRRRIPQHLANAVDRRVQAVIEVNKSAVGPEPVAQLLARDNLPRTFQQLAENLKSLLPQPDLDAALPQLARAQIHLENSESNHAVAVGPRHPGCLLARRSFSLPTPSFSATAYTEDRTVNHQTGELDARRGETGSARQRHGPTMQKPGLFPPGRRG